MGGDKGFLKKVLARATPHFIQNSKRYRQSTTPFQTLQTEWQTECKHSIGMLLEKESSSDLPRTEQAKGTGEAQPLSNTSN
jgi:hypothetical protein